MHIIGPITMAQVTHTYVIEPTRHYAILVGNLGKYTKYKARSKGRVAAQESA